MSEPPADLLALIHEAVDQIKDPCSVAGGNPMGLSEMGLIASVQSSQDGDIGTVLRLTAPFCHMIAFLQSEIVERVGRLPGVRSVAVSTDQGLDWSPDLIRGEARRRRQERLLTITSRPVDA